MRSRFTALGHAVHPMLIVFPLGLLTTAVIFDVVRIAGGNNAFALVSYWLIAAGVCGGLLAAIPGLIDWTAIPTGTRARQVGLVHAVANVSAVALFAISWWLRRTAVDLIPSTTALAAAVAGLALASVGGWLGGELVERLGMSVHEDANLNAPSSLG